MAKDKKPLKGVVQWFSDERGYGFIEGEDKLIYFVHWKDIKMSGHRTLQKGQAVTFFTKQVDDKIRACCVKVDGTETKAVSTEV